jgi:branched-chain amino acid transport system permease protein
MMEFPTALVLNAIIAGLLLGGFYAAVSVGISISFGMLDVVNIAHPAFIVLGSYIAYIVNDRMGFDPIAVSVVLSPLFFALGLLLYRIYYLCFEKRGQESLRGLAFFFGILFITEASIIAWCGPPTRRRPGGSDRSTSPCAWSCRSWCR